MAAFLDGERAQEDRDWLESIRDYFSVWTGGPDVPRAERLLAIARQDNDFQSERNLASYLACCAFAAGDAARALELSEPYVRSAGLADITEFDFTGRFALHAGRLDVAHRLLDVVGAGPGGVADHHIEATQAGIAALEGRRDDAVALFRSALAGYRTFGVRFTFALVVFDMVRLLGADDPAVRSVIEEARAILEELGARPLLDQLDELGGGGRSAPSGRGAKRESTVTSQSQLGDA